MRNILLAATILLVVLATVQLASDAARNRGRRRGQLNGHMEVTCAQIKPEDVCNHTTNFTKGFQVFDGCNVCTCGTQTGNRMTCSIKSCPRQEKIQDDNRMRNRVDNFCAKLARKVQRRRDRHIKKKMRKDKRDKSHRRSWPVKCFKEHKLCRDQPGVDFFDGCNQCRCQYPAVPGAAPALCESAKTCVDFYGTRREFKRNCRRLGASIAGMPPHLQGRGRRRGARRRGRGNRRRQKKQKQKNKQMEDVPMVLRKLLIRR